MDILCTFPPSGHLREQNNVIVGPIAMRLIERKTLIVVISQSEADAALDLKAVFGDLVDIASPDPELGFHPVSHFIPPKMVDLEMVKNALVDPDDPPAGLEEVGAAIIRALNFSPMAALAKMSAEYGAEMTTEKTGNGEWMTTIRTPEVVVSIGYGANEEASMRMALYKM